MIELRTYRAFGVSTWFAFCDECNALVKDSRRGQFSWLRKESARKAARTHDEQGHHESTRCRDNQNGLDRLLENSVKLDEYI
jgi:hypothetical protein